MRIFFVLLCCHLAAGASAAREPESERVSRPGVFSLPSIRSTARTSQPALDRGFEFYDNFPELTTTKSRWGRLKRRGMEVEQRAESWLNSHPAGEHFVWVHLYDPHEYEPPPRIPKFTRTGSTTEKLPTRIRRWATSLLTSRNRDGMREQ
jgi:hypothetical protein